MFLSQNTVVKLGNANLWPGGYPVYLQNRESDVQRQHDVSSAQSFQSTHHQDTEDVAEGKDYTAIFALKAGKEWSICIL